MNVKRRGRIVVCEGRPGGRERERKERERERGEREYTKPVSGSRSQAVFTEWRREIRPSGLPL